MRQRFQRSPVYERDCADALGAAAIAHAALRASLAYWTLRELAGCTT
jgi:hypothetical protein